MEGTKMWCPICTLRANAYTDYSRILEQPLHSLHRCTEKPEAGDKQKVLDLISLEQDFPKKGIAFRDIFPVFRNTEASEALVRLLYDRLRTLGKIDVIVGLESRGFLHGPLLAMLCGSAFAPVRKPGKLPGKVASYSYEKEYGVDTFEIQTESIKLGDRVVVLDDLIATGGSLHASCALLESLGADVIECLLIVELTELKGSRNVPAPVFSLFQL